MWMLLCQIEDRYIRCVEDLWSRLIFLLKMMSDPPTSVALFMNHYNNLFYFKFCFNFDYGANVTC